VAYATLMVQLEVGQSNAGLLQIAGDLAERFHAGIIGIALCQPMPVSFGGGVVAGGHYDLFRDETVTDIQAAEAEFHAALGPRIRDLEWRSLVTPTSLADYLADEARSADLVITKVQHEGALRVSSHHTVMGDLVMQLGRPILIVPPAASRLALQRAIVAWKDSRETRRAVLDALPVLKEAAHVTLVEIAVEEEQGAARARLGQVAGWLKRHGIVADWIAVPSNGDDTTQLNSIVHRMSGDIVVAGAYGHTRLREWVFGGVTRDLLLCADWCSFIAH